MQRGNKRGWRAVLAHVTGSRDHVSLMVGRGGVAPLPDPVALRIIADGAGYAMLRLDKADTSIAHTWHATLEAAKAEASTAFGVAEDEWVLEAAE
jgi:uncharacterized protein YqfA (UPF0365 family)